MTVVALMARDGIAVAHTGTKRVGFPGIVVRTDDAPEEWLAGADVLASAGLRFRVEDANAAAYWAVLAECLLSLRVVGANNTVVVGMGDAEHARLAEGVKALLQQQFGGQVLLRTGDHYALYAHAPWKDGGGPAEGEETTLLRVGAAAVRLLHFSGKKVVANTIFPVGFDEGVVYPLVRQAGKPAEPRADVHAVAWQLAQEREASATIVEYANLLLQQVVTAGWGGRVLVSGIGATAIHAALGRSISTAAPVLVLADSPSDEVLGLWSFMRLRLGQ